MWIGIDLIIGDGHKVLALVPLDWLGDEHGGVEFLEGRAGADSVESPEILPAHLLLAVEVTADVEVAVVFHVEFDEALFKHGVQKRLFGCGKAF